MNRLLQWWCLFLFIMSPCRPLHAEGFIMGTLVRTPAGLVAIETLAVGGKVISINTSGVLSERTILAIVVHRTDQVAQVTLDSCNTFCGEAKQRMYDPVDTISRRLVDYQVGQHVMTSSNVTDTICSMRRAEVPIRVYALSVGGPNTFLVTDQEYVARGF